MTDNKEALEITGDDYFVLYPKKNGYLLSLRGAILQIKRKKAPFLLFFL